MQAATAPIVTPAVKTEDDATALLRLPPTVLGLLNLEHDYPNMRLRSVALLQLVELVPNLSTSDYARVLGTPKPAISRLGQGLHSYGLMQAARDQKDKRLRRYTTTPLGKRLLETLQLSPAAHAA